MPTSFVVYVDTRAGLVGDDGTVYIAATIPGIEAPSEGSAAYFNGKFWGFASESGSVLCAPKYGALRPLRGGRAAFRTPDGSRWGVCDVKGNQLVQPVYEDLHVAPGPIFAKRNGLWGLLRADDDWIVAPVFEQAFPPGGGLWPAKRGGRFGAVDASGVERIPFTFDFLTTPDERVAPAKMGAGWGFLTHAGDWLVPPEYAAARCLGQGMLSVTRGAWNSPAAVMSPEGALLTDFVYDRLLGYEHGRCAFRRGERWGWLDEQGREVIPPRFFEASAFRGERAHAGGGCIVDRRGEVVARADLTRLAPQASPVHHAILRQDLPALRALAASGAAFELTDMGGLGERTSLARRFRFLVLDDTAYSPEAARLSLRAAANAVSEAPDVAAVLWRRWVDEGHGDALRDALVNELMAAPAKKSGPSTWLIHALAALPGLDAEPIADALIARLPVEAQTGFILHLEAILERTSRVGSPEHLRAALRAAIANAEVARSSSLTVQLRKRRVGPLASELLGEALDALSPAEVARVRVQGGDPAHQIGLLSVIAGLLEHLALCDLAPARTLAEHEDWAVATALGLVQPFGEAPPGWLAESPELLAWTKRGGSQVQAVLQRHGLLDGAGGLGLPEALPRGVAEALAFVDTLGLGPDDLERRRGLDEERLARIAENLGGELPPELAELLRTHGGFGQAIQVTLMDLEEGGSRDMLPIGADGTGALYLLARDGKVWHEGEVVAPTLGWFLARVAVEALGTRNADPGRTAAHLRALLARELAVP